MVRSALIYALAASVCTLLASCASAPASESSAIKVGPPNGAVVVVGGGALGPEIYKRFIELAGGPDALIIDVPTSGGAPAYGQDATGARAFRAAGAKNVVVLHTYDRKVADTDSFAEPIRRAGGVWFDGGRHYRLVDAYAGTKTEAAFHDVLARGGVVGGSSAGASILGSFLVRGAPSNNNRIMAYPGYEKGFGFLRGVGIDQHVVARERLPDLADSIMSRYPKLLLISEDEGTAWVVRGDTGEIIGRSKAFAYAGKENDEGKPFLTLWPGDRYNLATRRVIRRAIDDSKLTRSFVDSIFRSHLGSAAGTILIAQGGKILVNTSYNVPPQRRYMPTTTLPLFPVGEIADALNALITDDLARPEAQTYGALVTRRITGPSGMVKTRVDTARRTFISNVDELYRWSRIVPDSLPIRAYGTKEGKSSAFIRDRDVTVIILTASDSLDARAIADAIAQRLPGVAAQPTVDLLIRGGSVIDGTGSPARRADIGIRGDRIAFVGNAAANRITATRVIEATGLVVAPGFIDPHTHSAGDLSNPQRKANLNYLMQGVTTVINNNDGGGPVDIGQQLAAWTTNGIGTNTAVYIGQGSVRRAVMGMSDAAPTPAQLDSMKKLVTRAMDDGAIGLSTGLFYAPGSFSSTEEVIELAKVAAAKGGRYDSHIRDESSYSVGLVGAVAEVIRIGRETRMPVHISHIKALGVDVWGKSDTVIAMMKRARAEGIDITASQYPYTASGSSVGASLLPRWAEAGGGDSLRARIAGPATRQRLVADMTDNMRRRGGPNSLLITGGRDSTIRGKRLDEVARMWNTTPIEAALRIIQNGGASTASFNMHEKDIVNFMRQDFIAMDSDGSDGHPRKYGAYPKFFREYVAEKRVMPLAKGVERSTSMPAKMLGLKERGILAPNYFADVIAFDPATFADRATYEEPMRLAVGMKYVIVSGTMTIENGAYSGAIAGRVLTRGTR